jgi:TetR/AcrR family transcriptional repressor of lmrAB and yxaGH operons
VSKDSRGSMVRSAASLIGSHGVNATSLSDVLIDSGAPRGSIYHYFPDGKRQLAEEAIGWTSDLVLSHQRACPGGTAPEVLGHFIALWRRSVLASGGASGCAVAGVAIDTSAEAGLFEAVRSAFRSWVELLAQQLEAAGVSPGRAATIALTALACMEGALILCRAEGSVEPLEAAAGELMRLLPETRGDAG